MLINGALLVDYNFLHFVNRRQLLKLYESLFSKLHGGNPRKAYLYKNDIVFIEDLLILF